MFDSSVGAKAHAGAVDQQVDAAVEPEGTFDSTQVGLVGEICSQHAREDVSIGLETRRELVQAQAIARHENDVIAATGQPVGIGGADAGGGAGDEGRAHARIRHVDTSLSGRRPRDHRHARRK